MSGRLKKIIWLILMAEFVVLHIAVLSKLYLHGQKFALIAFLGGSLIMVIMQYLGYRSFMKGCAKNISKIEDEDIRNVFSKAISESGNNIEKVRIYEDNEVATPFVMGFLDRQSFYLELVETILI